VGAQQRDSLGARQSQPCLTHSWLETSEGEVELALCAMGMELSMKVRHRKRSGSVRRTLSGGEKRQSSHVGRKGALLGKDRKRLRRAGAKSVGAASDVNWTTAVGSEEDRSEENWMSTWLQGLT
jgi:hypothetical protein